MTLTPVKETHIFLDDQGKAWVGRTGVSVRELIESYHAYGESPEELVRAFPHLSLALVHAALSHYYDHREEIDGAILKGRAFAEKMRAQTPEDALAKRLREAGQLP